MPGLLDKAGRDRIVAAIREAESHTSGEIRVHLQPHVRDDVIAEARHTFEAIGLTATRERNGVLLFVAVKDRRFAILGDQGIDAKVPADFWETTVALMTPYFKRGDLADGIAAGVLHVGAVLNEYFPRQAGDINELSDEISTKDGPS